MRYVMRSVVAVVACGVVVAGGWAADEPIDAKKLLGQWELPKAGPNDTQMIVEMMEKGKLTMTVMVKGQAERCPGTYKLTGNKLEIEVTFMGQTLQETLTIVKLTDTELVTKDSKGIEETLKRVKEKNKSR
ncbi:MAG: TIGR03066 family protein [Gemmataceae bacterium]|nr:TIGR03066 family protein [Gemmata sp.]MDW8197076.1 TIGR03066 family protein [Gemmataceae bacterium]